MKTALLPLLFGILLSLALPSKALSESLPLAGLTDTQAEQTAEDELSPDEIRFEDQEFGEVIPPELEFKNQKVVFENPRNLLHLPGYGYSLIIHIDKSKEKTTPTAQTMRVFSLANPVGPELLAKWKISTGAETPATNKLGETTNRKTNAGFYHVQSLFPRETYKSRAWDVKLPWAIGYDMQGGFYIHATMPQYYSRLGNRASGGCTRLTLENARKLLTLIDRNGQGLVLTLNRNSGQPIMNSATGEAQSRIGYKTLVIVEDVSDSLKKPTPLDKQVETENKPETVSGQQI